LAFKKLLVGIAGLGDDFPHNHKNGAVVEGLNLEVLHDPAGMGLSDGGVWRAFQGPGIGNDYMGAVTCRNRTGGGWVLLSTRTKYCIGNKQ
jgi:hypothetical protein